MNSYQFTGRIEEIKAFGKVTQLTIGNRGDDPKKDAVVKVKTFKPCQLAAGDAVLVVGRFSAYTDKTGREWPEMVADDVVAVQSINHRPEPMPLQYDVPPQPQPTDHQAAKANGYQPGSVDDADVPSSVKDAIPF